MSHDREPERNRDWYHKPHQVAPSWLAGAFFAVLVLVALGLLR